MAESSPALKSIFIPEFGNQGQEMSCHVLWGPGARLSECTIELSAGLKIIHIYNVPAVSIELDGGSNRAVIRGVEENGYIGFVIQSERLDSPDKAAVVEATIKLAVGTKEEVTVDKREIRLIRPAVSIGSPTGRLTVRFPSNAASPEVTGRLALSNEGKGTALLVAAPSAESKVEVVDFFNAAEKTQQLVQFLKDRFLELSEDYPKHKMLLNQFSEYVGLIGEKKLDQAMRLVPDVQKAVRAVARADPLFTDDLGSVFSDAFRVTLTADEKFTGWIKGVDAMRNQRIVLLNPWASIRLKKGLLKVGLDVFVFDQLGHDQSEFRNIPIEIESDSEGLLPLFEILEVSKQSQAPV